MKKGLVLLAMVLLLTGCGKEKITCTYKDDSQSYKYNREVIATFEKDKLFSFKSTITEEHTEEETANNSYINYQNTYNNYNENNVISEFKKDKLKITAIYNIDLRDIETKKIQFEFDFTQSKDALINELKTKGFSCK